RRGHAGDEGGRARDRFGAGGSDHKEADRAISPARARSLKKRHPERTREGSPDAENRSAVEILRGLPLRMTLLCVECVLTQCPASALLLSRFAISSGSSFSN